MDNPYLDTLNRMEKDIAAIDASAGWASIAISLKRIADALEYTTEILDRIDPSKVNTVMEIMARNEFRKHTK